MATASSKKQQSARSEETSRAEQSVQAFRDALEKTLTISRDRLQEVLDDAVRRGRMTRSDADELVNRLVTRGRDQADDLLGQLERLVAQVREAPRRARQEAGARAGGAEASPEGGRRAACGGGQGPPGGARPRLPDHGLRRSHDPPGRPPAAGAQPRGAAAGPRLRTGQQGPEEPSAVPRPQNPDRLNGSLLGFACGAPSHQFSAWRRSSISRAISSSASVEVCARTASLASSLRTSWVALSRVSRQLETWSCAFELASPETSRSRDTASSIRVRTSPVAFSPAARRSSIAFWI